MRVLTYNIHGWRDGANQPNFVRIASVIEAAQADLVGLNEVFHPASVADVTGPALDELAVRLGMHVLFGPAQRWPAQDTMPANVKGNAILSRWPIIAGAAHHLTPKEAEGQAVLEGRESRSLLEARILRPDATTFTVYVTQLDSKDEAARLVQLRAARTWLGRDRNRPHLVLGDFNAISLWDYEERPAAYADLDEFEKGRNLKAGAKGPQVIAQMEKAGYTDTYQLFGTRGQRTHLPAAHPIRIDYIFASQPLAPAVKSCTIWPEPADQAASDHCAVIAEIDF